MAQFVNYNEILIESTAPVVTANNRAFCYGDALFETIRVTNNKPQFLKEHLIRLKKGMSVFKMDSNPLLNEEQLYKIITELCYKNETKPDARVRLTVFRNEGGLYTPENNSVSFIIQTTKIDDNGYILNSKGLTVDLFSEFSKPKNALSSIKSANSAIYVLAGLHKNKHHLDDCLLSNDKGYIVEAISSNLFAVKNGVLYTSPVNDGCVDGVMRKKIIEIAQTNKIAVHEVSILQNVLLSSDELFLTNAIKGIQWIVAYKQKRYFNDTSKKLIEKLNQIID